MSAAKTRVMTSARMAGTVTFSYNIQDVIISRVSEARDAGVTFKNSLGAPSSLVSYASFHSHFDGVKKSALHALVVGCQVSRLG